VGAGTLSGAGPGPSAAPHPCRAMAPVRSGEGDGPEGWEGLPKRARGYPRVHKGAPSGLSRVLSSSPRGSPTTQGEGAVDPHPYFQEEK